MAIIVPRRIPWNQKPDSLFSVRKIDGLLSLWTFTEGVSNPRDRVGGQEGTLTSTGEWEIDFERGRVIKQNSTSAPSVEANRILPANIDAFTVGLWIKTTSVNDFFGKWLLNAGSKQTFIRRENANFFVRNAADTSEVGATAGVSTIGDGNWHLVLCEADGAKLRSSIDLQFGSDSTLAGPYLPSGTELWAVCGHGNGSGTVGNYDLVFSLDRILSDKEKRSIYENPYDFFFEPRRRWVPVVIEGGAGATVSVGLAAELSSAFAISRLKQKAVGLSAENDAALATSPAKVTAVGLSAETDAAFSILRSKIKTAGLSTETDAAFALIISSAVNLVLSDEADSALAISRLKQNPAGLSTETDAALSVNRSKIKIAGLGIEADVAFTTTWEKLKSVGLSSELDQALAISSSGSLAVGLASELDVALVIGRLKQQVLGLSTETDLSQPVSKIKTQQAGLSAESDAALAVTGSSGRVVGLATETDLAQSISRIKQRLIGLAPETDVALAVTIAGVTVVINTSAKETLKLLTENPTLTLSAENETLTLS